jgi:hypothetical protein
MFYLQTSHRVEECLEAISKQADPARFAIGSIGNTTNSIQQHRSPEHSWYLLVLNYSTGFMQPESRLTNFSIHVSVFLL